MGYRSACEYLAIAPKSYGAYSVLPPVRRQRQGFVPKPMSAPNDVWNRQAGLFLERCQRDMWSDRGSETLAFLHDKGLSDWNIKAAALGLNLSDHHAERGSWGLPPEAQSNGRPKPIWIPSGLVIPYRQDDQVIRLRIRRPNPGDGPRYVVVAGSDMRPMRLSMYNRNAVVVESELDGLLVSQEAADLAAVVALGSVTTKPDSAAHQLLENSETILVSLDCDEAGAKAAWDFWPRTYGDKAKRWPCVRGKDPSEAWQNGLDIRCWIQTGISHS